MQKMYKWLAGLVLCGALLLWACIAGLSDGLLHVYVLDIGQGDSILIRSPSDEYILIDGGPDDKVIQELGRVMPFYEHTIDLLILSHPHADHVNGLVDVLKRYQVRQVMMSGVVYYSPGYIAFLEEIVRQKIPALFAGGRLNGGSADYQLGAVTLDMLFPFSSLQGQTFYNLNNSSIVFRLLYGERSFYFSGDAEVEEETKLLEAGLDLRADFFKAGHHGSRTSSTEPVLDEVRPSFAAISCGIENKFKHPHPVTLEHFFERKIKIYRTDIDGIIEAMSDGRQLSLKKWGKFGS